MRSFRRRSDPDPEALAHAVCKTVRDFEHYFNTIDHPKLEAWVEETIRDHLRGERP